MEAKNKIKVLAMDVDGTLTDGGIYIGNEGEVFKKFSVKDGYAISNMLPKLGILPIIITGRISAIVNRRCRELGIEHVIQGSMDKVSSLQELLRDLGIAPEKAAYMGDDLNDYEAMKSVGLRGCPRNSAAEIKEISEYIAEAEGGNGAVREFVEWIGRYGY